MDRDEDSCLPRLSLSLTVVLMMLPAPRPVEDSRRVGSAGQADRGPVELGGTAESELLGKANDELAIPKGDVSRVDFILLLCIPLLCRGSSRVCPRLSTRYRPARWDGRPRGLGSAYPMSSRGRIMGGFGHYRWRAWSICWRHMSD